MTKPYEDRLRKICDHISGNLNNDLSLEALSGIVGISKYHFHRLFSSHIGVNVHSYIQLLKFKKASYQLVFNKEIKIIDIALDANFDSHEAFSRAFKKVFGVPPTQFRNAPDWEAWHKIYQFRILSGENKMEVKVINFEEIQIAALEHRGAPELLNNSIPKFIKWRKTTALSPISSSRTFGIVYDDPNNTPPEKFRFDICGEVTTNIPKNEQGVTQKIIPKGRCAAIRHIGSHDTMENKIYYLYKDWLPQNNKELRDFPLYFQYLNFFPEVAENELITDIFLPIK